MTYTYNRKGITRKVLSEIVRGLGAKDELKILKWQRENARGMSARRVITMSVLFRHIYKATAPPARVNLWVGGGCRLVLDCVENCGQA